MFIRLIKVINIFFYFYLLLLFHLFINSFLFRLGLIIRSPEFQMNKFIYVIKYLIILM